MKKKVFSMVAALLFMSSNSFANFNNSKTEQLLDQSCFSFYHDFFHEHYGGINLDNITSFNQLVALCQAAFE